MSRNPPEETTALTVSYNCWKLNNHNYAFTIFSEPTRKIPFLYGSPPIIENPLSYL